MQSEIEVRIKCKHDEWQNVLNSLQSGSWSSVETSAFTDRLHGSFRLRQTKSSQKHEEKQVLYTKDYTIDLIDNDVQFRISHGREISKTLDNPGKMTGIRHVQRYSFVHKNYIQFDLSKTVCTSDNRGKCEAAKVTNEIEVELIGKHDPIEAQPEQKNTLYAKSIMCKVLDVAHLMHKRKPNSCETKILEVT